MSLFVSPSVGLPLAVSDVPSANPERLDSGTELQQKGRDLHDNIVKILVRCRPSILLAWVARLSRQVVQLTRRPELVLVAAAAVGVGVGVGGVVVVAAAAVALVVVVVVVVAVVVVVVVVAAAAAAVVEVAAAAAVAVALLVAESAYFLARAQAPAESLTLQSARDL